MNIEVTNLPDPTVTCSTCKASCCHLEVFLITDTNVPERYIVVDEHGGETMLRLDDGWCAALDRNTNLCTIYEDRPWVCREFEMGSYECIKIRSEDV
ncbi:MAG: Fe-S-cluster containining protein [Candidatus Azotimanducaceae bacterium]|jgi:Fe-S-cluster containining protein